MDNHITLLFILLCILPSVISQTTYSRSCDCIPTPDNKCAYTLTIPMPTMGQQGPNMCPTTPKVGDNGGDNNMNSSSMDKTIDSIQEQVTMLKSNVSSLSSWSGDQAKIISQLLSRVMDLNDVLNRNNGGSDSNSNSTHGNNSTQGCSKCVELQHTVANQTLQLVELAAQLVTVQGDVRSLRNVSSTLQSAITELHSNSTQQSTAAEELSQQLSELGVEVGSVASELRGLRARYGLCGERGLLVSGGRGWVEDRAVTASGSVLGGTAARGRIDSRGGDGGKPGAWCAGYRNDTGSMLESEGSGEEPNADYEWLQFDLGSPKPLFGLITRGRADYSQWVTQYKMQYSDEWEGDEGWTTYRDPIGLEMVFTGNTDMNTPVTHMLWQPITARYIRFVPLTSNESNLCMRADVIGCLDTEV